jgi:ribose transport system ATP-binding protein
MSDRILVMYEGQLAGELPAKASESEIMLMATGNRASSAAANVALGKE